MVIRILGGLLMLASAMVTFAGAFIHADLAHTLMGLLGFLVGFVCTLNED